MNGKTTFNPNTKFGFTPSTMKDASGKTVAPADICNIYTGILHMGLAVSSSISFVIIAINMVLKGRVIALLSWVKEATKS